HGSFGPWARVARGLGNTGVYSWTVPSLDSDSALVRVTAYDPAQNAGAGTSAGLFQLGSGTLAVGGNGPVALGLEHPTPNPSAGATRIGFSLPQAGSVRLEIYDLSGRRVWMLEGVMPAGTHAQTWNGRASDGGPVGGGLYFVRLVTPWGTHGERLVMLR
ncbi:MAG: FlgD immunoglobulin-like domain containing protein, partial [Candidatus Eisenbacteria bacterium]